MIVPGYDIRTNVREFRQGLSSVQREQLPYAVFLAVNATTRAAIPAHQRRMEQVLDRPKPFTKRGIYPRLGRYRRGQRAGGLRQATADASLMWREFAGQGTAAGRYLRPMVFGGLRRPKGHEVALRRRGYIGIDSFLAPASGQRRNQYGNLPRTTYVSMLSALGASRDATQNRTARSRSRNTRRRDFFVPSKTSRLTAGVWERKANGSIQPVLVEIDQPRYSRRYDFFAYSDRFVRRRLPRELIIAMRRATATARRR